jgi:hypothetical protein
LEWNQFSLLVPTFVILLVFINLMWFLCILREYRNEFIFRCKMLASMQEYMIERDRMIRRLEERMKENQTKHDNTFKG